MTTLQCLNTQLAHKRTPILLLSSSHEVNSIELTARLVLGQGLSLAGILFNQAGKTKASI